MPPRKYRLSSSQKTRQSRVGTKASSDIQFEKLEDRKMLASVVEDAGLVTVVASPQNDTIIITTAANPGFTDISINHDQTDAVFGRFPTSSLDRILVFAGAGDDRVFSSSRVPTEINGQAGNDVLNGGFADDLIRGNSGNNRIVGNAGNDRLVGGGGVDTILGGAGNDTLFGQGGADRLFGQSGDDVISAGAGNDRVIGGNGNDQVFGGDGSDFIAGNQGADLLFGNIGDDSIHGGPGNDRIGGREGNDSLFGNEGDDFIVGFTGNDLLLGQDGNDTLDGSEGLDELIGGAGEDFLEGGFDTVVDRLIGGTDNDTFVRRDNDALNDVSNGNGLDSVLDFRGSTSSSNNSGDGGNDSSDGVTVLPALLALFGPSLTGSVSQIAFNAASQSLGVETFGDTSVLTVGQRRFAFESASEGDAGLFGGLDSRVTLVGSFPASISSGFAADLSAFTAMNTTAHVIGTSLVVVDADGSAANVATVDGNGVLGLLPSSVNLQDFNVMTLISLLAGGQGLGSLLQGLEPPEGEESVRDFIFERFVFDQDTTFREQLAGLGLQGNFLIRSNLPITFGGSNYMNYDVFEDSSGNRAFILNLDDGRRVGYQDSQVMLEDVRRQWEVDALTGAAVQVQNAATLGLMLGATPSVAAPTVNGLRLANSTLGEVRLAAIFEEVGVTNAAAGEFFGWAPSRITTNLAQFNREGLIAQGYTREILTRIANAYDDIARITPSNSSALGRATQMRGLISRFF